MPAIAPTRRRQLSDVVEMTNFDEDSSDPSEEDEFSDDSEIRDGPFDAFAAIAHLLPEPSLVKTQYTTTHQAWVKRMTGNPRINKAQAVPLENRLRCAHGIYAHLACASCGRIGKICEHKIKRQECTECRGINTCMHGQRRTICSICGVNRLCLHGHRRDDCFKCKVHPKTDPLCPHKVPQHRCPECLDGPLMNACPHGVATYTCDRCGPARFPAEWCATCHAVYIRPGEYATSYEGCCRECYTKAHPQSEMISRSSGHWQEIVKRVMARVPTVTVEMGTHFQGDLIVSLPYRRGTRGIPATKTLTVTMEEFKRTAEADGCDRRRLTKVGQVMDISSLTVVYFGTGPHLRSHVEHPPCWHPLTDAIDNVELSQRIDGLVVTIERWMTQPPTEACKLQFLYVGRST